MALFAVPFAGVGLFLAYQSIRQFLNGGGIATLPMAAAALTFGGVGVGMIVAAGRTRNSFARLEARKAAAPGQPWLWRDDWASRRVQDTDRAQAGTLWAFALFWNLVSVPAAWFGVQQALQTGDKAPWLVLLFPAIGCILLAAAIYASLRASRYGRSELELAAVPAPIGRELVGTIHVGRGLDPDHGVQLELTSLRRVTSGSGKNRSTREEILWQDEQTIARGSRQYDGVSIPVRMAIPAGAEPCDDSNALNRVLWRLVARATTPGVDYAATFEVPVFQTPDSALPPPAELVERHRAELAEYRLPAGAPVRIAETGRGITVEFPMARNPGAALGLSAIVATWCGVFVALLRLDAPWFFRVAFGAFGLLLLAIAASLVLGWAAIEAGRDGLRVTKGWGPFTRTSSFRAEEVARIEPRVGMTAGSRAYFDLKVVFVDQSSIGAGSGLRDRRQAEWVAERVMRALGKLD
jgi:hypothetical protein